MYIERKKYKPSSYQLKTLDKKVYEKCNFKPKYFEMDSEYTIDEILSEAR